ncbi:hypothetical protein [Deinococcus navajonensis]|uniref:Uncharacterized protein n=1 Tax=Deinococcus navajonensis TaxID=309884 RepID=A0ABV8XR47_9DEIO
MDRTMFSRWDPLNPTNILAAIQLGWAFVVYHRPYLPEVLPSYSRFNALLPWPVWGWAALLIALGLLFTPRSSAWRLLAHAACGMYFLLASAAFGSGVGTTTAVTNCTILSGVSAVLFARTAVHWAGSTGWWDRLVRHPPRWLRRLARVQEFKPDPEEQDGG